MNLLYGFIVEHKKKLITIALLSAIAFGSTYILGPDNAVEESAEAVIKTETGVDVDFSPN